MARRANRQGIVAALDIGSSKVTCVIAQFDGEQSITVKGVAARACTGVKNGTVVDLGETEKAIRACVDQAEKMAGDTIHEVVVSYGGGNPTSHVVEVELAVDGHSVTRGDIDRINQMARDQIDAGDDVVLHAFPAAYGLDDVFGVTAPVGMYGKSLKVAMHVITAQAGPLKNLKTAIGGAHLNVAGVVLSPYASALATLVEDEMRIGCASVDIGEGLTGICIFVEGVLVHVETIPIGGGDITAEIARELMTPFDQAERLKTYFGSAIVDSLDERTEIEVPNIAGTTGQAVSARQPKSNLTRVMNTIVINLLDTISQHLEAAGFTGSAGRRVVLTGGVSQMQSLADLARDRLERQVRLGRPRQISGLPEAANHAGYSTVVGVLLYLTRHGLEDAVGVRPGVDRGGGVFSRMWQWLRDTF